MSEPRDPVTEVESDDAEIDLRETYRQQLIKSIGGWQGALIAAVPTAVFVTVNALSGLRPAIWSSLGLAGVLVVVRLARRQSVQQALSGAFGVGVCALIAARSGHARDFFLLGIWIYFVFAVPLVVSLLMRRPLIGLIWEFVDPSPGTDVTPWYRRTLLLRTYALATLIWLVTTLLRGSVQLLLYHRNATGWLAFTRIAMGYPLTIAALGLSFLLVRRARRHLDDAA